MVVWDTAHAPDTAQYFGTSVALSADGTVALVGDPSGGVGYGAATVYEGPGFDTAVSLAPPDTARAFGTSVALGGTGGATALVGDSMGGPSSRGVANSFTGAHWGTRTQLLEPANSKNFATSVALSASGSTAAGGGPDRQWRDRRGVRRDLQRVGVEHADAAGPTERRRRLRELGGPRAAPRPSWGTRPVAAAPGAATTYSGSGSTWSAGSPLTPPLGAMAFGTSVAVSEDGSTALVGDPEGGPTQVGTVTAYTSDGGSWNLGTAVVSPANDYSFGSSVALSENGSTLLGGDPGDGSTPGGEVTVYTDNGGTLSSGAQLDRPPTSNSFGTSIAVSGNGTTAIVGDPYDGATGAATIYTFNGTTWSSGTPLPPPETASSFGTSVALSADGKTALVGDPLGGDSDNRGGDRVHPQQWLMERRPVAERTGRRTGLWIVGGPLPRRHDRAGRGPRSERRGVGDRLQRQLRYVVGGNAVAGSDRFAPIRDLACPVLLGCRGDRRRS